MRSSVPMAAVSFRPSGPLVNTARPTLSPPAPSVKTIVIQNPAGVFKPITTQVSETRAPMTFTATPTLPVLSTKVPLGQTRSSTILTSSVRVTAPLTKVVTAQPGAARSAGKVRSAAPMAAVRPTLSPPAPSFTKVSVTRAQTALKPSPALPVRVPAATAGQRPTVVTQQPALGAVTITQPFTSNIQVSDVTLFVLLANYLDVRFPWCQG